MGATQLASTHSVHDERAKAVRSLIKAGLLVLLSVMLLAKGLVAGWRSLNTDFPNYYVVARLVREHYGLERIYEWIWLQRVADHFGIRHQLVGFLGLTPFSALPLVPFASFPVLEAKRIWLVCNVAILAGSLELLRRQTGIGRADGWVVALCALIPLQTSFLYGQMHLLVLALLVAAYVSYMRGWQICCGLCIAVAAALKVYPLLFCLYFLIKRCWKALGATVIGISFCVGLSSIVFGRAPVETYLFEQLPRLLQGESQQAFSTALTSAAALFHRLFLYEPELNRHPLIASARLFATLYPLWQALLVGLVLIRMRTEFQSDEREAVEWSMFLCLLMFLSSAPASYQFVVLIAAAVPTVGVLLRERRLKTALAYLVLYFLACNIRAVHPGSEKVTIFTPVTYLTLWCGVGLLVFYHLLLKPAAWNMGGRRIPLVQRPAFRTCIVVVCLWAIGGRSAWSHLKDIQTGSEPMIGNDGAYLRISPVATQGGFLYVAMQKDGYRVRDSERGLAHAGVEEGRDADQLAFATRSSGQDLWIESASKSGSRLVHVVSGKRSPACEVTEGESPALSSDGNYLAFLREDRGRGGIWMLDLRDCAKEPKRLSPPTLDVRTLVPGATDNFLVSSVYEGKERIFRVSPGAAPEQVTEADAALNSPALSPDGGLLVVRKLVSHRWQLASFNLSSHMWRQLTFGDCNAYAPSWQDDDTVLYSTDCMRGFGLSTLASLQVER